MMVAGSYQVVKADEDENEDAWLFQLQETTKNINIL